MAIDEPDSNLGSAAASINPDLFGAARRGSKDAMGTLIEACRDYLLLVANRELSSDVRQKVAASDLVQQTLVEACEDFGRFEGGTLKEFRGWLRQILLNNLFDATRSYRGTGKRNISRELPLDDDESRDGIGKQLFSEEASPSGCAIAAEEQARLFRAIERLPERDARVIHLRNLEFKSFIEIGVQMQLTADNARKVWERAVQKLSRELKS